MARIRSLSFTRSSAASRKVVSPAAKQAATARIGNSSMARTISVPPISIPVRSPPVTTRSATGSPPSCRSATRSTRAPMARRQSTTPVRVGFTPTPTTVRVDPALNAAATRKKAAEERSPGMVRSHGVSRWPPVIAAPSASRSTPTPKAGRIRSVWSRDGAGSWTAVRPCAPRPASKTHDFTCALAMGEG